MALKKLVNDSLINLTGYHLTKHQPAPKKKAPAKKAAAKKAPASKAPAAPKYPQDYDEIATDMITAVQPWTMTNHEKLYSLYLAVNYVVRNNIPGDIVECGVWRGGSMQLAAKALAAAGDTSRDIHLFDTYEGMPEPSERDVRFDDAPAEELMRKRERKAGDTGVWAWATLDDVKDGMSRIEYPQDKFHYVQGKVEDTLAEHAPDQISILRLDTDWYESTKHELEVLYPRLAHGGVLILDDYGWWKGSREAVDEFITETGERLLLLRITHGRITIKP